MTLSSWPRPQWRGPFFPRVNGEADPGVVGKEQPDVWRFQGAPDSPASSGRRYDLDWLRVSAFGLLILYHLALVYSPFDWHIKSTHTIGWVREALLASSPWRLTLLFLVSGAALRFLCRGKPAGQIMSARFNRLIPPLIFGTIALVPVQSWVEAMDKHSWNGSFFAWMAREFSPSGIADGVPLNHLWFLLYITVYSFAAVLLMSPRRTAIWELRLERAFAGWRLLVLPLVYLIVIRITLFNWFGASNKLTTDWYNHALYFGAFVFGFLVVGREAIWRDLQRFRWLSLAVACIAIPAVMIFDWHPGREAFFAIPRRTVFAIEQWATIAAILGFAYRHLRTAGGRTLSYLNDAIFPCYLAHQTILVLAAWLLKPWRLPVVVEVTLLLVITFSGSLLVYEIVRRIPVIRPLWGLKPLTPPGPEPYRRRRRLLAVGVAAPVVALITVLLALTAYPQFDHARQYLSELGGAKASMPDIFNTGVFAAGLMAGLAGAGFGLAIVALTNARFVGALTAVVFMLAGCGLAIAALYPWPDPRHMAINLGLGIQVAPLLMLWGLWRRRDLPRLKLFLAIIFLVMAVLTVLTKHLLFPGTVNDGNVGWWERAYAVVLVGWVGVAAFVLERQLRKEPATGTLRTEKAQPEPKQA